MAGADGNNMVALNGSIQMFPGSQTDSSMSVNTISKPYDLNVNKTLAKSWKQQKGGQWNIHKLMVG